MNATPEPDLLAGLDDTMRQALAPLFVKPAPPAVVAEMQAIADRVLARHRARQAPAVEPERAPLEPIELRRARYVSGLLRMDWDFEYAPHQEWAAGRDLLQLLRAQQRELDPDGALWRRHAPAEFHNHLQVQRCIPTT